MLLLSKHKKIIIMYNTLHSASGKYSICVHSTYTFSNTNKYIHLVRYNNKLCIFYCGKIIKTVFGEKSKYTLSPNVNL